ncbi:hypothetical protein NNJEOMEG_02592 [Fundidesulfovibrio magnetotacticus]|uniref:Uncharacterized protein n=1 Tax=Fundidesulfovibrio magnetotacticus TaxID=2730080 RepID=A0A6V8M2S9_9BACT|nr:hypothetical protein NNJEOMEG_02592 [Fundidesulfovibrio magnetotacticus]
MDMLFVALILALVFGLFGLIGVVSSLERN